MDRLGRRLREAREAKEATLQEAEAATHIRAHFLESLEAGDFAAFGGGDVQVRGFLCIYARYLDLSPDDVLRRYSAEVHGAEDTPPEEPGETEPEPDAPPDDLTSLRFHPRDIPMGSSLPRWMSVKTVVIVGLVLTTLLGILALATYLMNEPGGAKWLAPLTRTEPTQTIGVTTVPSPTATSVPDLPTPTLPTTTSGETMLTLEATEHVQVRVRREDEILFEEMMTPGQVETWTGDEIITVETGNGAALRVTVNGAELGALCDMRGELCTRAWGPSGEVTP
ncbi:MAG: helix-turn-helix domain-containing protein [Chloroflexota bacterium]